MRIYLIGPPVREAHDIKRLIAMVLDKKFGSRPVHHRAGEMDGPIVLKSHWLKDSRNGHTRRAGMQALELWSVSISLMSCTEYTGYIDSFSVVVSDSKDGGAVATRSRAPCRFETFAVIVMADGAVSSGNVIEWRTIEDWWSLRTQWIPDFVVSPDEWELCRTSLEKLREPCWQGLWNLKGLFPAPPSKGPRGDWGVGDTDFQQATRRVQLDNTFPKGLIQALAYASTKPTTYEALCRALLDCEWADVCMDSFAWVDATCPMTKIDSPESIRKRD